MPQSAPPQDDYISAPGPDGKMYKFPKTATPEGIRTYFAKKGIGKPSAAVGTGGRPIPGPGGVGTNFVTGPRAGPPPAAPPPAAAAGTPPPSTPTQQQDFGPGPGMTEVLIGGGKRGGQELLNLLQMGGSPVSEFVKAGMQTQTGQNIQSALQPRGSQQEFGADAADVLQYMIPAAGEESAVAKTGELLERYVPRLVSATERKMAQDGITAILTRQGVKQGEQIIKAAYQATTGALTGKVQGRDPATSATDAAVTSLVLGNLGRMSPALLRTLFNVKDIRGGDVGEVLAKRLSGVTRKKLAENSAKELAKVEGQLSSAFSKPIVRGGQISGLNFIIRDSLAQAEKLTFSSGIPESEATKVKGLLKDLERFSDSVAPGRVKTIEAQIAQKIRQQRGLADKLQTETNPDVRRGLTAAIQTRTEDIKKLKDLIANQPTTVSSSKLNTFRKTLEDNYMPYGIPEAERSVSERLVQRIYNSFTKALTQGRPETEQMLKDAYSLRDIRGAMLREERKSFGLHTIMDPAQLPRTLPPWVAWEIGHKAGGPAVGLLGAVAAGGARAPTAGAAKLAASPYTKGFATGAANILGNEPEDWSKKGKKTPYGPME